MQGLLWRVSTLFFSHVFHLGFISFKVDIDYKKNETNDSNNTTEGSICHYGVQLTSTMGWLASWDSGGSSQRNTGTREDRYNMYASLIKKSMSLSSAGNTKDHKIIKRLKHTMSTCRELSKQ